MKNDLNLELGKAKKYNFENCYTYDVVGFFAENSSLF